MHAKSGQSPAPYVVNALEHYIEYIIEIHHHHYKDKSGLSLKLPFAAICAENMNCYW